MREGDKIKIIKAVSLIDQNKIGIITGISEDEIYVKLDGVKSELSYYADEIELIEEAFDKIHQEQFEKYFQRVLKEQTRRIKEAEETIAKYRSKLNNKI